MFIDNSFYLSLHFYIYCRQTSTLHQSIALFIHLKYTIAARLLKYTINKSNSMMFILLTYSHPTGLTSWIALSVFEITNLNKKINSKGSS